MEILGLQIILTTPLAVRNSAERKLCVDDRVLLTGGPPRRRL